MRTDYTVIILTVFLHKHFKLSNAVLHGRVTIWPCFAAKGSQDLAVIKSPMNSLFILKYPREKYDVICLARTDDPKDNGQFDN